MAKKTVGVRLSPGLQEKLRELCAVSQRRPTMVLRAILATATPESLPQAWREGSHEQRALLAEIDPW